MCLHGTLLSTTGEPEAVLRQQLEFIYYQIIFVLTSKVHDILRKNPSKDIRYVWIHLQQPGIYCDRMSLVWLTYVMNMHVFS